MQNSMRDKFYVSVKTLSGNIRDIDLEVAKKKDLINASLYKIAGVLSKPVNDQFNSNKSDINQEIYEQLGKTLELIRSSLDDWQEKQRERLNQEKFRDEFKDSFLVIIYGKVKAGKSSLGNFIADQGKTYGLMPEFFKYDKAGNQSVSPKLEELEGGSFYVDNCEATNGIQGFKLAGLTWIDTPGLNSMKGENGELAKKYIDAADYILFPTSSDAPGRATDLKHILELTQNKNKRIDVIITKSDITEEDEFDGEIIKILKNKAKENRSKQENYIKETILKEVGFSIDPYSISVYTATKGIVEKDEYLYEGSQLELFYEKMTEIILNEAVELKANQPIKSLRAFAYHYLIGDVENPEQHTLIAIIKNLDETIDSYTKVLDALDEVNMVTEAEFVHQVELVINKHYSKINKNNDTKIIQEIIDELQKDLKDRAKKKY
jgi:predicted GTPase